MSRFFNERQYTNVDTQATAGGIQLSIYDRLIESCLMFLIIFTPLAYGTVQPLSIAIFEITAGLMLLLWIFKMTGNGRFEIDRNPVILLVVLFILYVSLQLIFSLLPNSSSIILFPLSVYPWATKTELLKLISYALIFLVSLNTIKTRQQITRILSAVIAVGFLMSIFFLMRYFGVNAPRGIINPDHFSGYLGMTIPLALGFLFARDTTYDKRFLLYFCITIMSTALFFTMSRGGMFSFIIALLFITGLLLTRKTLRKKGLTLSVVVILIILTIAWLGATPVIERISSVKVEIASRYFAGRVPIWQGTIDIIKDYPIFGTGFGTFNYIFPKYQPSKIITKHYAHAHSDFLELLSEAGIIGFSIFLFGLIAFVGYGFRRFRVRHDSYVIGMTIGIFGSLANIFVHSFADFNLHIPANAILLILIMSLFIVILNLKIRPQTTDFRLLTTDYRLLNISRKGKIVLYPLAVLLTITFITASVRPALADYYYQKSIAYYRSPITDNKVMLAKVISLDPTNAAYHYQLGKLYSKDFTKYDMTKEKSERRRRMRYTIDEYKKAVELNPTNSKYHQSLAWTYGVLADSKNLSTGYSLLATSNAHKHFQDAIRLDPNNPYRYRAYAIWLFNHPSEENIKKGMAKYRNAVEIEPNLAEEALTEYYKYQKNYKKPFDILPGTEESDYKVLEFLIKEKGLKFVVDFAKRFLKTYPHNAKIHFWIADRSFYDKDYPWEFTEQHYKIAFKIDPENAYYRMWHGISLCHRREYKKALNDLEKSIEMGLGQENEKLAKKHIAKCKGSILNAL